MSSKNRNPTDVALLRKTLTQNLTEDEHQLFVLACERSGLDPFARQIYFMKDAGKLVIQSTIDGLRISAERSGKYAGQLGPEWCGEDGTWLDIWTGEFPPVAARVGILRTGFPEPIWGKALFAEYAPAGDEFWERMPASQLAKCAEALGFRKAFPQEFSGLYTPEEMAQEGRRFGAGNAAPAVWRNAKPCGMSSPTKSPEFSDSRLGPSETRRNPEHGGGALPPSVPLPVRSFIVNGTCGSRENVRAAFGFLQLELEKALGPEGTAAFRRIYSRLPRVFKSREACSSATIACWCELWAAVEAGRKWEAA